MRTEQEIRDKIAEIEENELSRGEYSSGQKQALKWVLQEN